MFLINKLKQKGSIIVAVTVFATIFIVMIIGLLNLISYQDKLSKIYKDQEIALQLAESGINYYRWHLAHNLTDYADGCPDNTKSWCVDATNICDFTTPCGPYQHDYYDQADATKKIGSYTLLITPPDTGSTLVKIKSTGLTTAANKPRAIEAQYSITPLTAYALFTNEDAWFGTSENITGAIYSNGGIHMDGTNNSPVISAQSTYTCTTTQGCNPPRTEDGVWGVGLKTNLWQFPLNAFSFGSITPNLINLKDLANTNGVYYENQGQKGYHLIFKPDGSIEFWKVKNFKNNIPQYNDDWTDTVSIAEEPDDEDFVITWTPEMLAGKNGLIFIKDNVWVEGTVNGKYTLIAAKLAGTSSNYASIIITKDLKYADHSGDHVLGLITEKDIKVPSYAPNDLTIEAIMLAQNGRVFYNNYTDDIVKNQLTIYGSIISNKTWRWQWLDDLNQVTDGFTTTTSTYNNHAVATPPPFFPNTPVGYTFVSWSER